MKHTKGPWIYEQTESTCNKLDLIIKSQKESIGWVYSDNEANARLISCAPEFLNQSIKEYIWLLALWDNNFIHEELEIFSEIIQNKRFLIEKATGMKIEEVLK